KARTSRTGSGDMSSATCGLRASGKQSPASFTCPSGPDANPGSSVRATGGQEQARHAEMNSLLHKYLFQTRAGLQCLVQTIACDPPDGANPHDTGADAAEHG